VKNWKNGQIFQNGQMCFFMASVFKKWPNFSKLAMKWPMWQLWYCSWTPRTHRKQDILLWIHHSLVQLHYFIKEAHYYIKVKSGSFQRYWYTVYLQSIAVQISVRMKCPLESGENWAKTLHSWLWSWVPCHRSKVFSEYHQNCCSYISKYRFLMICFLQFCLTEELFYWLIVFSVRSNFSLQILRGILHWC